MNAIKVTTDNKVYGLDLDFSDINSIEVSIGNWFEIVRTDRLRHWFKDDVVMCVDEMGACVGLPVNMFASLFYGGHIFGDVIFCLENHGELTSLPNAESVFSWFLEEFDLVDGEYADME